MWPFTLKKTWSLQVELGIGEVAACDLLESGRRRVSGWKVVAADVDGRGSWHAAGGVWRGVGGVFLHGPAQFT